MCHSELEQRLKLAARQLSGSVRRRETGQYDLRIGYPFALNPNDAHAVFRVSAEATMAATVPTAADEAGEADSSGKPAVSSACPGPSSSPAPAVSVELLSRPLSPRRRCICAERLLELRVFFATPAGDAVAPLKRIPAFRLWGFYNLLTTLSSFVISGTLVAFASGVWLWLLGTQQILSLADRPGPALFFFGEPSLVVKAMVPAVKVTTHDALGGAFFLAVSTVVPLSLVLCCIFLILEVLPRSATSFVLILLLWGVYFVWFFSAWLCGALGVAIVVTMPIAALLAYRLGWEMRGPASV
jgi:hypothetical protein